jgi:hypothetical protein
LAFVIVAVAVPSSPLQLTGVIDMLNVGSLISTVATAVPVQPEASSTETLYVVLLVIFVGDIELVTSSVLQLYLNGETPAPLVPAVSVVSEPGQTCKFPLIVALYVGVTAKSTSIGLSVGHPRLSITVTLTCWFPVAFDGGCITIAAPLPVEPSSP